MGFASRLEGVALWHGFPVVLKIAPATAKREGVHRAGMAVTRQHAGIADPQQVDVVALAHTQDQRLEPDPRRPAAPRASRLRRDQAHRGRTRPKPYRRVAVWHIATLLVSILEVLVAVIARILPLSLPSAQTPSRIAVMNRGISTAYLLSRYSCDPHSKKLSARPILTSGFWIPAS